MFKTLLFTTGLSTYHFITTFLFQMPQEIIVPTWVEKLSVISILAIVIYYLYKENEKQKTLYAEITLRHEAKFDNVSERIFNLELQSLATIRDFQAVLLKISETLININTDVKDLSKKIDSLE